MPESSGRNGWSPRRSRSRGYRRKSLQKNREGRLNSRPLPVFRLLGRIGNIFPPFSFQLALFALMPGPGQKLAVFVFSHLFPAFFDHTAQPITPLRFFLCGI
jgi:hypothetical protein